MSIRCQKQEGALKKLGVRQHHLKRNRLANAEDDDDDDPNAAKYKRKWAKLAKEEKG